MERENFLEEEIEESDEDSLMSQIIHEIGRSGTLKRKGKKREIKGITSDIFLERKSIQKIFDYETEPTKTIDDSDSGTISEIESIQDEDMEEIQEPKFESLDNLLIQQDQEKFEKELPPPIPEKSEDTILKVKRARKSRLSWVEFCYFRILCDYLDKNYWDNLK